MTDSIIQLGRILQQEMTAVSTIAQNTANVQTPGYKSQSSFITSLQSSDINKPIDQQRQLVNSIQIKTAALQPSTRSLDLAITGSGWFWIQYPEGKYATRYGGFTLNSNNQLVTTTGGLVLNLQGEPITLSNDQVSISSDGTIWDQKHQQRYDQLAVIASTSYIQSDGQGRYQLASGEQQLSADAIIHQYALEGSNVDMAYEMVKLMEFSRHIETVQKALATYNGMLESGINQLGK
jgi:flagellar basal-body rod protein FlgF